MKEIFRLNQHLVKTKHDLWIVMKSKFDQDSSREAGQLFLTSLKKIDLNQPSRIK